MVRLCRDSTEGDYKVNIVILGANGWIPTQNETSCLMVEYKNQLILLDAGTGIANLNCPYTNEYIST